MDGDCSTGANGDVPSPVRRWQASGLCGQSIPWIRTDAGRRGRIQPRLGRDTALAFDAATRRAGRERIGQQAWEQRGCRHYHTERFHQGIGGKARCQLPSMAIEAHNDAMATRAFVLASCLAAVSLFGCSSGSKTCISGASVECACPNGEHGAQICSSSGSYGVCACSGTAVDAGGQSGVIGTGGTIHTGGVTGAGGSTSSVDAATPTDGEVALLLIQSVQGVSNNPTAPSTFTVASAAHMTKIMTYHWNSGQGAVAGTLALENTATLQTYGPWKVLGLKTCPSATPGTAWATASDGPPFYYWTVQPDADIPAGTYAVVDSDPSTWAYTSDSNGRGIAWVFGTLGSGSTPGIDGGPIQGASDGGGSLSGLFTLTATTPDSTNVAVGSYPSQKDGPGFGYEVISCSPGLTEIRFWCTADINGVSTLGNFQARWEWTNPPAEIHPGDVWPISGTATVVKNDGICTAGGEIATGAYFWPNNPASIGPTVSDSNPAGYATSEQAVGTCQTGQADFDTNIGLGGSYAGACAFWYHYKWNP